MKQNLITVTLSAFLANKCHFVAIFINKVNNDIEGLQRIAIMAQDNKKYLKEY